MPIKICLEYPSSTPQEAYYAAGPSEGYYAKLDNYSRLSTNCAPQTALEMNESEQYIANFIHTWVWSGFYSLTDIHSMMEDIMESDADEQALKDFANSELKAKLEEQVVWPQVTDCDRLDAAFNALNSKDVITLQNAGYTMSDGYSDVAEVLAESDRSKILGYCFYHGQDLERAVGGDGLLLAFGDLANTSEGKTEVGKLVKEELEHQGLEVEWDGNPEKRINVRQSKWQRRAL